MKCNVFKNQVSKIIELHSHLCELRLQRAASRAFGRPDGRALTMFLKKIAWISTWIIHADSTWIIQGFLEDRTLIPRGSNMDQIQSPPHDRSTWNPCMTHVESLYDPRGIPVRSTWNPSNNFYSESQSDLCYSRGPGREHVAWVLVTLGKSAALLRKVQEMCSAQELTSECPQRPGALSYKARRGRRATAAAAVVVGSRCLSRGREVAPIPVRPRNGADPQSSALPCINKQRISLISSVKSNNFNSNSNKSNSNCSNDNSNISNFKDNSFNSNNSKLSSSNNFNLSNSNSSNFKDNSCNSMKSKKMQQQGLINIFQPQQEEAGSTCKKLQPISTLKYQLHSSNELLSESLLDEQPTSFSINFCTKTLFSIDLYCLLFRMVQFIFKSENIFAAAYKCSITVPASHVNACLGLADRNLCTPFINLVMSGRSPILLFDNNDKALRCEFSVPCDAPSLYFSVKNPTFGILILFVFIKYVVNAIVPLSGVKLAHVSAPTARGNASRGLHRRIVNCHAMLSDEDSTGARQLPRGVKRRVHWCIGTCLAVNTEEFSARRRQPRAASANSSYLARDGNVFVAAI
ncbi:unnamed protein product [Trichogramma brassicae]|uniref:Uncharacterized protein n=1 Tax=Trichogramma brassicae TaxID=86971 RepID=A0A6H5IGG2_9HYME|nr:unnamed protein product [Trichogramma brassicae]